MMNQNPALAGIYKEFENSQDSNQLINALKHLASGNNTQSSEDDATADTFNSVAQVNYF